MEFALLVFSKLIALFCLVGLGFIGRKVLGIDRVSVAQLVFYILSPLVFFNATSRLEISLTVISLPLLTTSISAAIAFLALFLTKRLFDDETRAIFAFSSANSNVGYFLLPIVWEIFDELTASIYVVMILGNSIFENTVGFFIASNGKFTVRESVIKVLKLPAIYAMIFGFIISSVEHFSIPVMFNDMLDNVKGAYATLGMMIIGFGLADIKDFKLDLKFISASLVIKFILWPLLVFILSFLDKNLLHFYDPIVYKMLILFSLAPMAANNIVIASILNLHPEKVAASVVVSTVFALFYVPIMIAICDLK